MEGSYVKVVLPHQGAKMRSYTIRSFDPSSHELALDFVVNRHTGPVTNWAQTANVGDSVGIAGPGPMKMTHYNHHSYLLVGDITSLNAINGYIPRFRPDANIRAVIEVPTEADIIAMDYDSATNTQWFIEQENPAELEQALFEIAAKMPLDTHVFLGLEAQKVRSLRALLQDRLGFSKHNISAVGYWKRGIDADEFSRQKQADPL